MCHVPFVAQGVSRVTHHPTPKGFHISAQWLRRSAVLRRYPGLTVQQNCPTLKARASSPLIAGRFAMCHVPYATCCSWRGQDIACIMGHQLTTRRSSALPHPSEQFHRRSSFPICAITFLISGVSRITHHPTPKGFHIP